MAAQPIREFVRLPGTARNYRTPDGNVISRYERDSIIARRAGWKNAGEVARARRTTSWEHAKAMTRKMVSNRQNYPQALHDAFEVDRRRRQLPQDILGHREVPAGDPILAAPDGPLARLLIAQGRRDASWRWEVGSTPTGVRA